VQAAIKNDQIKRVTWRSTQYKSITANEGDIQCRDGLAGC